VSGAGLSTFLISNLRRERILLTGRFPMRFPNFDVITVFIFMPAGRLFGVV
jgi:hypothetical protein